ncbi:MAG: hypothetical protein K0Q75_1936 [Anaerospora sp.]|nr:hypothetical protein [Anaerospora sp.]
MPPILARQSGKNTKTSHPTRDERLFPRCHPNCLTANSIRFTGRTRPDSSSAAQERNCLPVHRLTPPAGSLKNTAFSFSVIAFSCKLIIDYNSLVCKVKYLPTVKNLIYYYRTRYLYAITLLFTTQLQASAEQVERPSVTVTGHAEMAVVPDTAYISLGIVTTASDVAKAKAENDATMNRIYTAVELLGINKEQIQTSGFSIQPQYKQNTKNDDATVISGYRVQNTVTVKVTDFAQISQVIDASSQAGANQINGLRFAVNDESSLKDQLLAKAILDGKHKAALIAETLGGSLGQATSVNLNGYSSPMSENVRLYKADMASSTPISAGTLSISADVNMAFQLNN